MPLQLSAFNLVSSRHILYLTHSSRSTSYLIFPQLVLIIDQLRSQCRSTDTYLEPYLSDSLCRAISVYEVSSHHVHVLYDHALCGATPSAVSRGTFLAGWGRTYAGERTVWKPYNLRQKLYYIRSKFYYLHRRSLVRLLVGRHPASGNRRV